MKYLGIFESELPGKVDGIMQSGIFLMKLASPIYDRYELWKLSWRGKERRFDRIYTGDHGLIICFHGAKQDDRITASTVFSKYSTGRSYTKTCGTLQDAVDLIIENYARHSVYTEIPGDPSIYWEPCVYNNKAFFNYRSGGCYFSGYRRRTGKVFIADSCGRSVIKGKDMTMEEVADYLRTLRRLNYV